MSRNKCDFYFYQKARDYDTDAGQFAFGPFCLKTGAAVRCEVAIKSRILERTKKIG